MTDLTLHLPGTPVSAVPALATKTLYDNLVEANIHLRKACINGACGVCRCRLMSGAIDYRGRHPYGLNGGQQADGWILPCIAYPKTDLKLMHLRLQEAPQ
ncbi:MAG: 2Fe-2S iron-sulfur cluster-binding protein [Saccharospirillum sp.]